jgi:hypothetical protein
MKTYAWKCAVALGVLVFVPASGTWKFPVPDPGPRVAYLSAATSPDRKALPLQNAGDKTVWRLVRKYTRKYDIADQAHTMFRVIYEESRFFKNVQSDCGRYIGICQFTPSTFYANVEAMRDRMLIPKNVSLTPFNPEDAIQVMAYMWSRGYKDHWGPTRWIDRHSSGSDSEDGDHRDS